MSTPRRTEGIASRTVTEELGSILVLTTGQPTTEELEEAQRHVLALQRALREWVSARHLTEYANRRHESPEAQEEIAQIEAAHPAVLAPPFDILTRQFREGA